MDLLRHWIAYAPVGVSSTGPSVFHSEATVDDYLGMGWRVEGPFVRADAYQGAVETLRDVANCSPAFEDRRMGYVEVQIDWPTWDELAAYRGQ